MCQSRYLRSDFFTINVHKELIFVLSVISSKKDHNKTAEFNRAKEEHIMTIIERLHFIAGSRYALLHQISAVLKQVQEEARYPIRSLG